MVCIVTTVEAIRLYAAHTFFFFFCYAMSKRSAEREKFAAALEMAGGFGSLN